MQQTLIQVPVTVVASEETWLMLGLITESDEELINEALRNAMDLANAPHPVAFMTNIDESGVHAMTWRSHTPPRGIAREVDDEDGDLPTNPMGQPPFTPPPPPLSPYEEDHDGNTSVTDDLPPLGDGRPPLKAHAADTSNEDRISFLDDWLIDSIHKKQAS